MVVIVVFVCANTSTLIYNAINLGGRTKPVVF